GRVVLSSERQPFSISSPSLTVVPEEAQHKRWMSAYRSHPGVLALKPAMQHYAWGDPNFIPALLGDGKPDGRPCAELWMGAHPDAPAGAFLGGSVIPLDRLLEASSEEILHRDVAARFRGRLPFLFKVLAAAASLSRQTH